MKLLNEGVKFSVLLAPQADGQADDDSLNVDMAGYDGVMFICLLGTITGSGTVTMVGQQAATDIAGDALDGASVVATGSADSDLLLALDIYQPTDRYVGVNVVRAVANSVLGGVLAIQYRGRSEPITQAPAQMAATLVALVSPDEA